jgi:hypothetical protein
MFGIPHAILRIMKHCKICQGTIESGDKRDSHSLCEVRKIKGLSIVQLNAPEITNEFKAKQAKELALFTEMGARMNNHRS